ncbi:MAG TPA: chorismate-binding protein, partial [Acidimicrobiia bacterium]|nr:chorismate-binding protein [Acidimicrobiia bacterium]
MTSVASPAPNLRAVTRPFDPPDDLLEARDTDGFAWLFEGRGLVTAGTAAVVDVGAADALLADIESDDPLQWPGTGPLAVGALGFEPGGPAQLVVPRTVIGRREDGRGWITHVGDTSAGLRVPPRSGLAPSRWTTSLRTDRQEWRRWVEAVLDAIARGDVEKVVLAREVLVEADRPLSPARLLDRLRDAQPGCFVHYTDGLIGASPELLVRRTGRAVESRPMAGTARVGDDLTALGDSGKDGREHRFVVDDVAAALTPVSDALDVPPDPVTCAFASVGHLTTPIRGVLAEPPPTGLRLARRLHPTAAVAGTPTPRALERMRALEPRPRGRYAGPVGWVDGRGDGEWALALRGAELDGHVALLRAGAGIVA